MHHSALGIYGLLAEMPLDRLGANIPPGLRRLLDSATTANDDQVRTLETYLDNAGEVKRTSEKLHIHRTSLYYRLKRIQETTGLSLSSGDDRLSLHLGLKIARLIEHR
ncbi:PucR family transcriptional regulator [Brevibacterium sp. S22]|nr:PucR family transcriptional regulator [Brevibacterium sp. S22]